MVATRLLRRGCGIGPSRLAGKANHCRSMREGETVSLAEPTRSNDKVAHYPLAFPIGGVESLEESHPSRLPP